MRSSPPQTTGRQKVLLALFGLSLTVVVLAAAEGLLAVLDTGRDDRFADPYVGFDGTTPLFLLDDNGARYHTHPAKLKFFNEQSFAAEKTTGTYRIFTLGGSTTAGRPYDDHVSFARWLERYLPLAQDDRTYEVVNAGAISYASYRVVLLMKELVRYEPDLFVVLTGHNEFLEERTYRDVREDDPIRRLLRARLARFRLSRLAWQAFEKDPETRLADEVRTRLDVWTGLDAYERDDALARSISEHFAFNLNQMTAIARNHDVELLFVKPVSNLKDFSPFKSQHGDGVSEADRERFRVLDTEGRARLDAGAAAAALERFEAARTIDPDYADVHFRLGRSLLALGRHDAARTAFVRAKELDVAPLRARERLSELVAETAEREGVPLIDLPALLERQNEALVGHNILGREVLLDHVHPDIRTHRLIAEQVITMLADRGVLRLGTSWTEAARQRIYNDVVGVLDRDYYAERDLNLAKVLGWAGKLEEAEAPLLRAAEVLEGNADLHLNLGTLWQKTGRFQEAAAELERAVVLAPKSPEARFNLGVAYGRLGRHAEGIAALEEALRLRADYAEAQHNLDVLHRRQQAAELTEKAVSLARAGRLDAAAADLKRAVAGDPSYAEAHYNQGLLEARRGRPQAALAAYERVLELRESHALTHNNLGILKAGLGDLEEARRHLARAVEIDPSYAEAYLNLGVVYDNAGLGEQAVAAVERALELRPADSRIHLALAMLYLARGRHDESLPHFEAARRGGQTIPPEIAARLGNG